MNFYMEGEEPTIPAEEVSTETTEAPTEVTPEITEKPEEE